ncbi:MAG: ATPase domain-containing protein, partial [Candidatus Undinarchaeales archaeon]
KKKPEEKVELQKKQHKEHIGKQIKAAREFAHKITKEQKGEEKKKEKDLKQAKKFRTGIKGFDSLMKEGIPEGSAILVAGGPGTGKTIFCLQVIWNAIQNGKKCLYMSFEENEDRLKQHMRDFGWDPKPFIKKGTLQVKRFNTLDIARSIEALLSEAKKELLIDIQPVLVPEGFEPEIVVIDSLSAIASAFSGEESRYRIYIEQLFRFLEQSHITSFLITETTHPESLALTESGIEGFLADGIIVLYNVAYESEGARAFGIEVLKMRGEEIAKKIVNMDIVSGKGIVVYPKKKLITDGEFHGFSAGFPI